MPAKVPLDKSKVIVFMGSMNAMPMMYALELKTLGYEVIYFVDAPKRDVLCRPEHHYPGIHYPYPGWIVELVLPSQILLPLIPRITAAWYKMKIKRLTKKEVGCFVLNGFFVSLAPYFTKTADKIGLSHGSDLDAWADTKNMSTLANSFTGRAIFKFFPKKLSVSLIKLIVERQYLGFSKTKLVLYFPRGFSWKRRRRNKLIGRRGSGLYSEIRHVFRTGDRAIPRFYKLRWHP